MIIEKKLSDLAVGHYVVEIKLQDSNYILSSPRHVKSTAVINNLIKKGIKSVLIDDEKTIEQPNTTEPVNNVLSQLSSNELTSEKVKIAKDIFSESKTIQHKIFSDAKNGCDIDLESISKVTNKSVDVIFNNPDSLTCLVNMRKKDEYLLEHSISVSIYLSIFANYLNLDKKTVYEMAIGAFLHDVGKIMIPDYILNKPSKLSENEFFIMKTHAKHSADIIEHTSGISHLSYEVAAFHHEKLDGTGYPFQLKANKISKFCRMMQICDIFDALTADRCYKEGFSRFKAFTILRGLAENNHHLDCELVEDFIKAIGAYPVGALVKLNSNKIAVVERKNYVDSMRPGVKPFFDCNKGEYQNSEAIDLSLSDDFIVKEVKASEFNLDMPEVLDLLRK